MLFPPSSVPVTVKCQNGIAPASAGPKTWPATASTSTPAAVASRAAAMHRAEKTGVRVRMPGSMPPHRRWAWRMTSCLPRHRQVCKLCQFHGASWHSYRRSCRQGDIDRCIERRNDTDVLSGIVSGGSHFRVPIMLEPQIPLSSASKRCIWQPQRSIPVQRNNVDDHGFKISFACAIRLAGEGASIPDPLPAAQVCPC